MELTKISDKEYFEREELNFSKLKNYFFSGKYFLEKKDEEVESDSVLFGSIVHAQLLDQERLSDYLPMPKLDKRTKAGKEEAERLQKQAEEEGKILVAEDIYNEAIACTETLTPVVKELLDKEGNICEHSLFWQYRDIKLKSKIDIYNPNTKTLIDIKTTKDFYSFDKAVIRNKYYLQMGFYALALKYSGYDVSNWKIIAIENTKPYDSTVFDFSQDYRNFSMETMMAILERFDFDNSLGGFKGVSEEKEITLELPSYL